MQFYFSKLSCLGLAVYIVLGLELATLRDNCAHCPWFRAGCSVFPNPLPPNFCIPPLCFQKNVLRKQHLKRYLSFGAFHPLTRTVMNPTIARLCHGTIPENTVHISWPLLSANRICSFCLLCLFHGFPPSLAYFGFTEYFELFRYFPFQIF